MSSWELAKYRKNISIINLNYKKMGLRFGVGMIERVLGISHNEAINTIEQALDDGVLTRIPEQEYLYKFTDRSDT